MDDLEQITQLLGKKPQSDFRIAVRDEKGTPLVIENAPFFFDGTPMPTRYWLLDGELYKKVSYIESIGGVKQVQEEINEDIIEQIHAKYELERNKLIDPEYEGPKPSGGVGGTRRGVKCLHAHVANLLATGDDAVGQWTLDEIEKEQQ